MNLIGRIIDEKYQIEALISEGGMGSVYTARRLQLGDRVAVKVINVAGCADPIQLKRFHLEAESAAAIRHPNVVTIHDYGMQADLCYLVMEQLYGPPAFESALQLWPVTAGTGDANLQTALCGNCGST